MRLLKLAGIAVAMPLLATSSLAQEHEHKAPDKLGSVHFQTSCAPAVTQEFDRAVALLHSFQVGAAIRGFTTVLGIDSTCAMAHWGIALGRWQNPMTAGNRSTAVLERGKQAADAAMRLAPRATPREQQYIAAVAKLYADYEKTSQRERQLAYESAMSDVAMQNIADTEATIFYALAMIAAAPPTDKTYSNQLRAGSMLESMWAKQPDHPGLAHYIIHAYDVPALAPQARAAAQRYAGIAPAAPHALHMPSHTFTRLGMWEESVATNLKSIEASLRDSTASEGLHAMDYAVYAYLQMRKDSAAKALVDQLPGIVAKLELNTVQGAAPPSAGMFARAAIPARWALERRDWKAAAAIVPKASPYPYTDAISWFTRSLGAARTGDRVEAWRAIDTLRALSDRLKTMNEAYWAEQVAIQALEARAVLNLIEGLPARADSLIREAVSREDATEKSAVTPGPLIPAHELFGDLLLERRNSRDALAEYRLSIAKEPNRYRSLYGAMKAAQALGDRKAEGEYAAMLAKLTGPSTANR